MLHVERGLALALRHLHARVEGAQRHHVAQALEQLLVAQQAGPRADRLAVAVEHADDRIGEIADGFRIGVDLRARHRARPWIRTLEKSGVPPGRTAGSGTWSFSGPYSVISYVSHSSCRCRISNRFKDGLIVLQILPQS